MTIIDTIRWALLDRRNKSLRFAEYILHGRDDYREFSILDLRPGGPKPLEACPSCRLKDLFCPVCRKQKLPEPDGLWFDSWWICNRQCVLSHPEAIRSLPTDVYCKLHQEALDRLKAEGHL